MSRCIPFALVAWLAATSALARAPRRARSGEVRLVLQLVVDQLRGDVLRQRYDHLGPRGFRRLLDKGAVYRNAHYQHANTETIVGHAVLATGAYPADHGMVANVWLDQATGELGYNIEDPAAPLVGEPTEASTAEEADPTQALARTTGRSPAAILATTFSDELMATTAHKGKAFAVSLKDRGAVSLAGHAGKAFWFSKKSGRFISSAHYYDRLPTWARLWNRRRRAARFAGTSWTLRDSRDSYRAPEDDRDFEPDLPTFGRVFPHVFPGRDHKLYTTYLTMSPAGDDLTLEFAAELLEREGLGRDSVPDFLGVSLSANDYVGHFFGPSSLESEDNLRRLDDRLAQFLDLVDRKVGLDRTLIVLSADHGAPDAPEVQAAAGLEADEILRDDVLTPAVQAAMKERFGRDDLVKLYFHPYVYLNPEALRAGGIDRAEAQRVLAEALEGMRGIFAAVPTAELARGRLPDTPLNRQVLRNHHPRRSGDVYLIQRPYWFLYPDNPYGIAVNHGSPWRYDTHVPIVFAGPGVRPGPVDRLVHPVDIAATLAARMGTRFPSACRGTPLPEASGGAP